MLSRSKPSFADVIVAVFFAPNPLRALLYTIAFFTIAFVFASRAVQTRFFGAFTIITYPYYQTLISDIAREPAFVRRIGSPIVVDDAGVWCSSIAVAAAASTSECTLPVRGPRGLGQVVARSRFSAGRLRADLTLHDGAAEDRAVVAR